MDDKELYNNELLNLYEELEIELIALLIMRVQKINYNEFDKYEFKKLQKDEGRKIYNYTINKFNEINVKRQKACRRSNSACRSRYGKRSFRACPVSKSGAYRNVP